MRENWQDQGNARFPGKKEIDHMLWLSKFPYSRENWRNLERQWIEVEEATGFYGEFNIDLFT